MCRLYIDDVFISSASERLVDGCWRFTTVGIGRGVQDKPLDTATLGPNHTILQHHPRRECSVARDPKANDNLFTTLPWDEVLGWPLVRSSQRLRSFFTVGSYLAVYIVHFLHHKQKAPDWCFSLTHRACICLFPLYYCTQVCWE